MIKQKESSKAMISELSFCVFDLETTGGNHHSDKIIEIGMVKVQNLEILAQKEFLINPEIHIPDFIQKLTSILPADIKDSPKIEEVMDEILEFMGDSILVAHNTSFDIPFLNSVLKRLGRPLLNNKSICTNLMTKYLIPNLLNSNLNYMSKVFGIKHKKAHRALDDAAAAAELLLNYLNIFIEKGIQKINHLYYPRNRYELDRINFKNDSSINEIMLSIGKLKNPYILTLKGENGIIQFCYPASQTARELPYLEEKLKSHDWQTCTILLYGPYLEALITLNNFFLKLDQDVKNDILKFLWQEYFPSKKPAKIYTGIAPNLMPEKSINNKSNDSNDSNEKLAKMQKLYIDDEHGDYVIMNHLVPEQFIVFPLASMHKKSELIFRYPGHKKKLIQYFNAKTARLNSGRLKKIFFNPQLKEFISEYVKTKAADESEILLISRDLLATGPEAFLKKFEKFSAKNPNANNYPKEYI